LDSISTAVHSGTVIPVVNCPTDSVIVLSLWSMASRTLSYAFLVSSSSESLPSPAASTISYSPKTGCALSFFARAFALSTRFSSQKVCFSSARSSGVENGNFSCEVSASRKRSIDSSYTKSPFALTEKNRFRSKAYSSVSPSISTPCCNSSRMISDI